MIDLPVGTVVALYGRTSGDRQKKEESIKTQFAELVACCERLGLVIYDQYGDEAVQNTVPLEERDEGGRLLRDAEASKFEAALVYKSSRLARDTVVFHHNRKLLGRAGVTICYLQEDLKFDTPSDRLTSTVKLAVNEYEKDSQGELMLSGRYRIADEGFYTGGVVDYGYTLVSVGKNSKYALCEVEAPVVDRMYEHAVVDQFPIIDIARLFTAEGIETACARRENGHRPSPQHGYLGWSYDMIARMLRKPVYMGLKTYGGGFREKVAVRVPPIVTPERWHEAQNYLKSRVSRRERQDDHTYLLSGRIRCGLCEKAYGGGYIRFGNGSLKHHYYYTCNHHRQHAYQHRLDRPICAGPMRIRADAIEAGTWEHLAAHIRDTEGTLAKIRAESRDSDVRLAELVGRRDRLMQERGVCREEQLLAKRGKSRLDFELTRDEARQLIEQLDLRLAEIERQGDLLAGEISRVGDYEQRLTRAESNLRYWAQHFSPEPSRRAKRHLVELFVEGVLVFEEAGQKVYECHLVFDGDVWSPDGRKGGVHRATLETSGSVACNLMLRVRFHPA